MRYPATVINNIINLIRDGNLIIVGCCVLHCVAQLSIKTQGWGAVWWWDVPCFGACRALIGRAWHRAFDSRKHEE